MSTRGASRDAGRRKFKIDSNFGSARQWRSRKSRPCDVYRRRKTVCVITSEPPCLFCKGRGLECTSAATSSPSLFAPVATPQVDSQPTSVPPVDRAYPLTTSTAAERCDHSKARSGVDFINSHARGGNDSQEAENHPALNPSSITGCGRLSTGVLTLEDNENRTAHSMGPAAEQDTYVLDSIPSGILSSPDDIDADMIQVFAGTKYPWDPPVHFCLLQDEFAPHDDLVKQASSDAIENLVGQHGPVLVRLYFKHVHPVLPILSKGRFLRQYASDRNKLPASLRGAVYALASVFQRKDASSKGPLPFEQHQLVHHATDSLQRELDSPNLAKLQASLLLLHIKPNHVDSIEHPRTWTSSAQAVATAQIIGLHQDAERWSLSPWEKKLRRKLWWATFVTDVWSAVCHGNPPHIYPSSFNTTPVTMDDLRDDEELSGDILTMVDPASQRFHVSVGARFLEMVRISEVVRQLVELSFQVPRLSPPKPEEMTDHGALLQVHARLRDWKEMLPRGLLLPAPEQAIDPSNNGMFNPAPVKKRNSN